MKKQLLMCGLLMIAAGCGGGDDGASDTAEGVGAPVGGQADDRAAEAPAASSKAWDPALGTATITGTVKFTGKAPKMRPIDMSGKPECAALHAKPVIDESIIVNANGTLKNAFVWVKSGLKGWKFSTPSEPAMLDQKGCTYVPHILGVQTRQEVKIRNSDAVMHNIHATAKRNGEFNFSQAQQNSESSKTFRLPEVMVKVKCDVHGWMSSYIGVVPHPFFTVSGEDGAFELKNLPPGEYTIEAWHEEYGTKTVDVKVADKESKAIEFAFDGK